MRIRESSWYGAGRDSVGSRSNVSSVPSAPVGSFYDYGKVDVIPGNVAVKQ